MPVGSAKKAGRGIELALQYIDGLKLNLPDTPLRPNGDPLNPQLPYNITKLQSDELGELYGQFNAVAMYAAPQLGKAEVELAYATREAKLMAATLGLTVEGANKDERSAHVMLSPPYQKLVDELMMWETRVTLLKELVRSYERGAATLSRELTRRGIDDHRDI